jgi:hypothetical protein
VMFILILLPQQGTVTIGVHCILLLLPSVIQVCKA